MDRLRCSPCCNPLPGKLGENTKSLFSQDGAQTNHTWWFLIYARHGPSLPHSLGHSVNSLSDQCPMCSWCHSFMLIGWACGASLYSPDISVNLVWPHCDRDISDLQSFFLLPFSLTAHSFQRWGDPLCRFARWDQAHSGRSTKSNKVAYYFILMARFCFLPQKLLLLSVAAPIPHSSGGCLACNHRRHNSPIHLRKRWRRRPFVALCLRRVRCGPAAIISWARGFGSGAPHACLYLLLSSPVLLPLRPG